MEIDLKQLKELMRALKQFDIQELAIEKDGERIELRRGPASSAYSVAPIAYAPSPATVPPPSMAEPVPRSVASEMLEPDAVYVTSPFVGTFYRAPSPDAASFVQVGDTVRVGQPLCIVEAMKLMNEIESEFAGQILEVLAVNGKPVEYGDRLFRIKKA